MTRPALFETARASSDQVLVTLHASRDGLTDAEVEARLREIGSNAVPDDASVHILIDVIQRLINPLTLMLLALSGVSAPIGDYKSASVMASMILPSVGLQPSRSGVQCVQRLHFARKDIRQPQHFGAISPPFILPI